ncbi:MAG TPA: histidine kinase dimerization/phospho-acceptor domain-containing protein, partial [Phycisphaerales bacterium]|nr:histidine kinase dimerization/phospho-acceptor domain-containing protein [Phycisphaerales bacterium]
MSYRMRVALTVCVLVACSAAVGGVCLWVVNDVYGRHVASDELYGELRGLYEVGHHAETAEALLNSGSGRPQDIRRELLSALRSADELISVTNAAGSDDSFRERLGSMRTMLEAALVADESESGARASESVNACMANVAALAGSANKEIVENRRQTTQWVRSAMWTIGGVFAGTLMVSGVLGLVLYRSIAKPVMALRSGVDRLAERRGEERISKHGPREFRDLIERFNRMSDRMCLLERSQAQQMEARTQQLVKSEQLAGVGYIAAGAAHEINHPLGVIGGYAEMMLRRLDSEEGENELRTEMKQSLKVITEEVFRCHEMTTGLLQCARQDRESHEPIDIGALAERVGRMVQRLPIARERRLMIERTAAPVMVRGSRGQLTQVLLNLITNALEAVEVGCGEVNLNVHS